MYKQRQLVTWAISARGNISRSVRSLTVSACVSAAMRATVLGFIAANLLESAGRRMASSRNRWSIVCGSM